MVRGKSRRKVKDLAKKILAVKITLISIFLPCPLRETAEGT